jgi:hypothetical protein
MTKKNLKKVLYLGTEVIYIKGVGKKKKELSKLILRDKNIFTLYYEDKINLENIPIYFIHLESHFFQ